MRCRMLCCCSMFLKNFEIDRSWILLHTLAQNFVFKELFYEKIAFIACNCSDISVIISIIKSVILKACVHLVTVADLGVLLFFLTTHISAFIGSRIISFKANCPLVGSQTIGCVPSVGVFLWDSSPYLREFRRKPRETPNN